MVGRLSQWSQWSPWWAESHNKNEEKQFEKNIFNTVTTSPRGPCGGQALPLILVVPVVGRISHKKMKKKI
jgi:hypothetical protein